MLCCGYTLTDFPISIRLTSLALWQSNDCPSASKATLMNMDKYFMWIHYERLHNHNKAKHNKTVCIFPGIYRTTFTTTFSKIVMFKSVSSKFIFWTSNSLNVIIGSGNDLMLLDNMSLPGPMMTKVHMTPNGVIRQRRVTMFRILFSQLFIICCEIIWFDICRIVWLTLIPTWISNHMTSKVWNKITRPLPNVNDCTVEVW